MTWSKPLVRWIKLNVDGSCRGKLSPCGGGGILRDDHGIFKASFLEKLEDVTNNGAELQALISGVKLYKSLGFEHISIETNFDLVVGWVKKNLWNS